MEHSGQEEKDWSPKEHIRPNLECWCWKLGWAPLY